MSEIPAAGVGSGQRPATGVSWLELFYDLVLVAAIVVFSTAFSLDPTIGSAGVVAGAFAALWWIWLATTSFQNRYRVDDAPQRALVLLQMFLLVLVAVATADGLEHNESLVSIAYAGLTLSLAVMYARQGGPTDGLGTFARHRRDEYAAATVAFGVAALPVPDSVRYLLWALGLAVTIAPALMYRVGRRAGEPPLAEHHFVERMGLLTIIVCGESFVKVGLTAADGTLDEVDYVVMGFLFVLIFGVWWAYFDDVPVAGLPPSVAKLRGWIVAHLVLHVCIIGIAVGVAKFLRIDFGDPVDSEKLLIIGGAMTLAYLALAVIGYCSRRVPDAPLMWLRLTTAVAAVLFSVATWRIDWIDFEEAVVGFSLIAIAHAAAAAYLRRRTRVVPAA